MLDMKNGTNYILENKRIASITNWGFCTFSVVLTNTFLIRKLITMNKTQWKNHWHWLFIILNKGNSPVFPDDIGCLMSLGSLSWGVADITDAGMGGIVVGVDGCFANSEASILFFSHSLLLPVAVELTGGKVSNADSGPRFAGWTDATLLSSPSSLGRLRARPGPSGGEGEPVWKPRLLRSGSCQTQNNIINTQQIYR